MTTTTTTPATPVTATPEETLNHLNLKPTFINIDLPMIFLNILIDKYPKHKKVLNQVRTEMGEFLDRIKEDQEQLEVQRADFANTSFSDPELRYEFQLDLEDQLNTNDCDHSYKLTNTIFNELKITDQERLLEIFQDMGGFCDCEVYYNVLS